MSTTFVLSGGASLGAVQVGMLQALAEHGICPDLVVGTSAGALNAAFIAGAPFTSAVVEDLASVWRELSAKALFRPDPQQILKGILGRSDALCSRRGLEALVRRHLTFDRLEQAFIPCAIIATDLLTGEEVALQEGDARTAVLASCSIPGVFSAVLHEGRVLVDGALANMTTRSSTGRPGHRRPGTG